MHRLSPVRLSGINILIFGSMIPVIHYFFYCNLKLKTIYISVLIFLSVASTIGTSSAACSKPRCRPFKAVLFIALGLYGSSRRSHSTFHFLLFSRCRASCACLRHTWLSADVSNGISVSCDHGRGVHWRRRRLRRSSARTVLSR